MTAEAIAGVVVNLMAGRVYPAKGFTDQKLFGLARGMAMEGGTVVDATAIYHSLVARRASVRV